MIVAYSLLALCVFGIIVALLGWWLTNLQAQRWERARQEVRERLAGVEYVPNHIDIVACETHNTVSTDYCPECLIEELVVPQLRPGGVVVHSYTEVTR